MFVVSLIFSNIDITTSIYQFEFSLLILSEISFKVSRNTDEISFGFETQANAVIECKNTDCSLSDKEGLSTYRFEIIAMNLIDMLDSPILVFFYCSAVLEPDLQNLMRVDIAFNAWCQDSY